MTASRHNAKIEIRFHPPGHPVFGLTAWLDRAAVMKLHQNEAGAAEYLGGDPDRLVRAEIAEALRTGIRRTSGGTSTTEDHLCWWLIWKNGDTHTQRAAGIQDLVFDLEEGPEAMTPTVYVTIARNPRYRLPERRLAAQTGGQFAPLAQLLVRALAADQIQLPVHAARAAAAWARQTRQGGSIGLTKSVLPRLREARKYVWDESFSQLVGDTAWDSNPSLLARFLTTARLPFDEVWIEWNPHDRARAIHRDLRCGALFRPSEFPAIYEVVIAYQLTEGLTTQQRAAIKSPVGILPVSLNLSFREPMRWQELAGFGAPEQQLFTSMVWNKDYYERWEKTHRAEMDLVAQHVMPRLDTSPYGTVYPRWAQEVILKRVAAPEALWQYALQSLRLGLGTFCELLAGLSLSVTHIDEAPLVHETTGAVRGTAVHGKILKPFSYKVVHLVRPQEASHLWRRLSRRLSRGPMPLHPVSGHWKHRAIVVPECRHHPRACARATWEKLAPPDGVEASEFDSMRCVICRRLRWWTKSHDSGDISVGRVEHGYEITASGERRRRVRRRPSRPEAPPPP